MRHRPGTLGSASTSWPATTASSAAAWACSSAELRAVERVEHPLGVGDQIIYEPRPLVGVVPVTHRPGPSCRSHGPAPTQPPAGARLAHTPNLRADHRDGVLGRDRVDTAPWSPAPASSLFDSAPHSAATSRTASKIRSGHPLARSLWRHSVNTLASKPPSSMPSPAAAFQRTSQRSRSSASRSEHPSSACRHHHHRDHRPRHRRPPPRPEEILEQPVRKQPQAVLGQEPMHRPLPHQAPTQAQGVQQFPIQLLSALHTPILPHPPTRSRAPRPELLSSLLGALGL